MRMTVSNRGGLLSDGLAGAGLRLDLRCGGRGTCGRCRVRLLDGEWQEEGRLLRGDASGAVTALACRCRLLSESGTVAVPPAAVAQAHGKVALEWSWREPLPATPATVIAVDIGTTTVAAVKLCRGQVLAKASAFNRQSVYGDNVIARIQHAGSSAAACGECQRRVVETIDQLLGELGLAGVSRIAVAGNTVMSLLLHGIDPTPVGVIPFTPPQREFAVCEAVSLGLSAAVPLYTVPAISGYVGGDLTAGLGEVGLRPGELLVDIGTNCEIVFHAPDGRLVCAAAAAGPAFEGAGIACGSRAVAGAIDHYFADGSYSVLGGGVPLGLCGSAMVDFLAEERRAGRLTECGRFEPAAAAREIAPGLAISEWDISQLLKAKAAVYAGIQTLCQHCGAEPAKIYLAGGFAQYMRLDQAMAIGMLPECAYEVVGNTSLAGAARLAADPSYATVLAGLIDRPQELPLNSLADFSDNFIDALMLP